MKIRISGAGLCLFFTISTFVVRAAGQPVPNASSAPAVAQPVPTAPASTNGIGPRIQFDSLNYEFGSVRAGMKVTHDFVFTNTGDAKLEITGVQPGCHCTTVGDWTHEVEPGKTGVIPIQFDSSNFGGGPIVRAPVVICNDRNQSRVTLQLHGTITKPVDYSPSFVFLNIAADASDETNGVVHIINNEDQPLFFARPTSSQPAFATELRTNAPGKTYDLIIKTVPPLAAGNYQSLIVLTAISNSMQPINISVVAVVAPSVTVIPPEIALPAGPLKSSMTISAFVQNKGSHDLTLSEPSLNADGAKASVDVTERGKRFTASVEFPAGFTAPAGKPLELSIKTDSPRSPVVKIPIKQAAAPPVAPTSARISQ
jgi:hypothetical protein